MQYTISRCAKNSYMSSQVDDPIFHNTSLSAQNPGLGNREKLSLFLIKNENFDKVFGICF